MQEIRAWFDGPLALSGSIANGGAILAAQAMGADFAYIGSPFIATPEARFALAMDRLQAVMLNAAANGGSWREHQITYDRVVARNRVIEDASPVLWQFALGLLDRAVKQGHLAPPPIA